MKTHLSYVTLSKDVIDCSNTIHGTDWLEHEAGMGKLKK